MTAATPGDRTPGHQSTTVPGVEEGNRAMTAAGSDAIEAPNLFTLTGHHLSIILA